MTHDHVVSKEEAGPFSARDHLYRGIVTVGWTGMFPFLPGTVGSGACVVVAAALHWQGWLTWPLLVGMIFAACALNVALGSWINQKMGTDPRPVVIDEAAGQWISCVPILWIQHDAWWWWFVAAFFLFRGFDITKVLGISWWERFPRGWGILLDDCVAGVYVALLITGAAWWMGVLGTG